ncbi:MAG: hypothetical protein OXQ89_17250 [Rhodospirillaceae bacterium]|nr:hypothetical protein [Rhodospirillaceae bacterium]
MSEESWPAPSPDGTFELAGFLSELDDGKLRHLQEEVQQEARRRGWMRKSPKPASRAKPSLRRRATGRRSPQRVESAMTKGQERLARAALAAGASAAAVAKELGIGRAQVAGLARTMKTDRPPRS